mmetsp:Transcript_21183/g.34457  ORF Transcript_21183/g.34457 Transcript_21183/m.34457 type:complete len:227 (-) Transcript_21183:196-876(-)|eukprot:CAMPEP_0196142110 /NCGR_PEP_ID=MMETSP0910-20130528/11036_1 /TAXON_ID=49265 /ORGANISM="Thalassiosira rotula, Strain GSO102" /LENGTH=226 /DNA_ID=CAMNT_0041403375 /DNA_START=107 /DNA_END=787 /DNA_ORIENTATION=+
MVSYSTIIVTAASLFMPLARGETMADPQSASISLHEKISKLIMSREQDVKLSSDNIVGERSRPPQWFTTDNASYQNIINNEYNQGQIAHNLASLFCHTQNLYLCKHSDYCPDGVGNSLFGEPSSLSGDCENTLSAHNFAPVQWAPMFSDEVTPEIDNSWVQVDQYGEGEGTCWPYDEWTRGVGGNVEEKWGEIHRKWILCCESMSEQEMWEMSNLPNYLGLGIGAL